MNIQIFGKSKCFDTRKAERYFKERGLKAQYVDVQKYGMSAGEFRNVKQAVGGVKAMADRDPRPLSRAVWLITPMRRPGRRR